MKASTLKDSFGISVTFASDPDLNLAVDPTSITPPGLEGGDAIDTTTHSNTQFRTKYPRTLIDISNASMTAIYDPDAWNDIVALINENQQITFSFPDNSSIVFYGYLQSFVPNEFVEGSPATAEMTIVVTNDDGSGESAPVYTAGS